MTSRSLETGESWYIFKPLKKIRKWIDALGNLNLYEGLDVDFSFANLSQRGPEAELKRCTNM